ncbi:MAG: hypothetical protein ACXAC8_17935 [Candidatus Hodarchaeales archaeon]|jgi:hypothetical protein
MERKGSYTMMFEVLILGLTPNATLPSLGKIDDVVHDLASLDYETVLFSSTFETLFKNSTLFYEEMVDP